MLQLYIYIYDMHVTIIFQDINSDQDQTIHTFMFLKTLTWKKCEYLSGQELFWSELSRITQTKTPQPCCKLFTSLLKIFNKLHKLVSFIKWQQVC